MAFRAVNQQSKKPCSNLSIVPLDHGIQWIFELTYFLLVLSRMIPLTTE
jgi:hypothetical protein